MNKLGQLFILGFRGTSPSREFIALLQEFQIGGIILFSENIGSLKKLKQTISHLRSLVKIPLLVMIDQEGGKCTRIKQEIPCFPANRFFGEKKDQKGVYQAYKATAEALFDLGINVNLAPVVDVLTNPKNTVIKERSFGKEPQNVAELSAWAIKGIKSGKLLGCAKHFPGLGGAEIDPHQNMAVNSSSKRNFERIDFLPFKRAIEEKIDLVMTTHILCPHLDKEFPATFSRKILNTLKTKLQFKGLVITDDMEMGGIKKNYKIETACEKAFSAGHDLILICHSLDKQIKVLKHFQKKLETEKEFRERVEKTYRKIVKFKKPRANLNA
jgi:beta-N-acetylhexosaminidase